MEAENIDIKELANTFLESYKETALAGDECPPAVMFVSPSGATAVEVIPWVFTKNYEMKDRLTRILHATVAATGAIACVFISDGWAVKTPEIPAHINRDDREAVDQWIAEWRATLPKSFSELPPDQRSEMFSASVFGPGYKGLGFLQYTRGEGNCRIYGETKWDWEGVSNSRFNGDYEGSGRESDDNLKRPAWKVQPS